MIRGIMLALIAYLAPVLGQVFDSGKTVTMKNNYLSGYCSDTAMNPNGCILDEKLAILTTDELENEQLQDDNHGTFTDFDVLKYGFGTAMTAAMAAGDTYKNYKMLATSVTFKVGTLSCEVDGQGKVIGLGESADFMGNSITDICFKNMAVDQEYTYVPGYDVVMSQGDFTGANSFSDISAHAPRSKDISSSHTTFNKESFNNGLSPQLWYEMMNEIGACDRSPTDDPDTASADCSDASGTPPVLQCGNYGDSRQYQSQCKPYMFDDSQMTWDVNLPAGVPYPVQTGVLGDTPFLYHDCGSSENIIHHIDLLSGELKCLYPTTPSASVASDNYIKVHTASGTANVLQQNAMWYRPMYKYTPPTSPGTADGGTLTIVRATHMGHWRLMFGDLYNVDPMYQDISWAIPDNTLTLGYNYDDTSSAFMHSGCQSYNGGWVNQPDDAQVCTYVQGSVIRARYLAQQVSGYASESYDQVLASAVELETVTPYTVLVVSDPITFGENADAVAYASGTQVTVAPGDIICHNDAGTGANYFVQELRVVSDEPGVFSIYSVTFQKIVLGSPSSYTVSLEADDGSAGSACRVTGSMLRADTPITDDMCTSGTVRVVDPRDASTNHVASIGVALFTSDCKDDMYATSTSDCVALFQALKTSLTTGDTVRMTVTGAFHPLREGSGQSFPADVTEVQFTSGTAEADASVTVIQDGGATSTNPLATANFFSAVVESNLGAEAWGSEYDPAGIIDAFDGSACSPVSGGVTTATFTGTTAAVSTFGNSVAYLLNSQRALRINGGPSMLYNSQCSKISGATDVTTCAAMQADQHISGSATKEYHISLLNFIKEMGQPNVFDISSEATQLRPVGSGAGVVLFNSFFGPYDQPFTATQQNKDNLNVPLYAGLTYECVSGPMATNPPQTLHIFGGVDPAIHTWNVHNQDFLHHVLGVSGPPGHLSNVAQRLADLQAAINQKSTVYPFENVAGADVEIGYESSVLTKEDGNTRVAISATSYSAYVNALPCAAGAAYSDAEYATARKRFTGPPDEQGTDPSARCAQLDNTPTNDGKRRLQTVDTDVRFVPSACTSHPALDQRGHILDGAGAVLTHNHNCETGPAVTLVTNNAMAVEHGATVDDAPNTYGAGHFGGSGPGDGNLDLSAGKGKGEVFDIYEILSHTRTGDTTSVWDDWKATLNLNGQSAPTSMAYIGLLLNAAYADQCSTSSQLGVTKWSMKTQFIHTTNRFGKLPDGRRALEVVNVSTHEHEFVHVPAKRRMQEDTPDNVTAASTAVVSGRTGTCQDGYAQVSETSPFTAACVCKDSLVASPTCHAMLKVEEPQPPPPPPPEDDDGSSWFLWLLLGVTVAITLAIVVEVRSGQRAMYIEMKEDIRERSRGKHRRP